MEKVYAVALKGWAALSAAERIAAEVRFARAFEHALGGVDQVMPAWLVYQHALEEIGGPDDMRALETPYARAMESASQEGWAGLPQQPASAAFLVTTEGDDDLP